MNREKILIEGMSCEHCVMAVRKELSKLELKINKVKIGEAEVEYDSSKLDSNKIKAAVEEAGYKFLSSEKLN